MWLVMLLVAIVAVVFGIVGACFLNREGYIGLVLVGVACVALTVLAVTYSNAVYKKALRDVEVRAQEREALVDVQKQQVEDTALLAYAIWYEARGEGEIGQRAVASVIWNRAGGDPGKLVYVITRRNWLGNTAPLDVDDGDWADDVLREDCWAIARELVKGTFKPMGPWTHFYNPKLALPTWGMSMTNTFQIGGHLFGVSN